MSDDRLVQPETFWTTTTAIRKEEIKRYLASIDAMEFMTDIEDSLARGFNEGECAISLLGKLCYKSIDVKHNDNLTRVRNIEDNVTKGIISTAHGSVLEHCWLGFIIKNCSRVFTHELCRHRAGTAFSQTSGRYVRLDRIDCVWDPILDGCEDIFLKALDAVERAVYLMECAKGLRKPPEKFPHIAADACIKMDPAVTSTAYEKLGVPRPHGVEVNWPHHPKYGPLPDLKQELRWVPDKSDKLSFDYKKAVTSAIRRIAPNGIANEMGFSLNIRALRHILMLRTAPSSEREIRLVFGQIYDLIRDKFPLFFCDAKTREVNGLLQVYGMKTQPYELSPTEFLATLETEDLEKELQRRRELENAK